MKVVIVGGVAAGASAAARLRRLDEFAEITLIEKGPAISYANCGLPYHVGGVIPDRDNLLVMSAEGFRKRFNVDVRTSCEATAIDRTAKTVTVRNADGSVEALPYDRLLLATGATPIRISVPGLPDDRVFTLNSLTDMDRLIAAVRGAKSALVIGGGAIGVETAENLAHRGLTMTLVEKAPNILPAMLDPEMATWAEDALRETGVDLRTKRTVASWADGVATLDDGATVPADLVVMALGVRPNSALAQAAGLDLGAKGHIKVNAHLQTSDPDIFAAGDVAEVDGFAVALAGPANLQGRAFAKSIVDVEEGSNLSLPYDPGLASGIVKVGALTAAGTGVPEARLKAEGKTYTAIYAHPLAHAGYYPGATPIHVKVLMGEAWEILGAQAVGTEGVDKLIDVINASACDISGCSCLSELNLCYAPPYGSAKAPVNMLGMIAENAEDELTRPITPAQIPEGALLLDVREPAEVAGGTIPGAVNIPLGDLRDRLGEVPKDRPIVVFCKVGQRGYFAERLLSQRGYDVVNLSGGYTTWLAYKKAGLL